MTRRFARTLAAAMLAILPSAGGALRAADAPAGTPAATAVTLGPLRIETPWLRATPGGATVGAGYLTIKNTGNEPDRLTTVSFDKATNVEIHEMRETGEVMQMRKVEEPLPIEPGATLKLAPGGYHLMLLGLKAPLKAGDTAIGTLTFEKAGSVTVVFPIAPIGASGPSPSPSKP